MSRQTHARRRPGVHITLGRAARLHRLVSILAQEPRTREGLLTELGIGLRTFYRELELLKRCGVRVRLTRKTYSLLATADDAEGRLPFPDPQLSFAEMAELSRYPGAAAQRLSQLLERVVNQPIGPADGNPGRRKGATRPKKAP